MTEGRDNDAKMAAILQDELDALQRQRDQYALAMDAATDPKVAIRLQRTLERIEDEIEGLHESLQALSERGPAKEPDHGPTAPVPDWDDDEPSTAIYDAEAVREQLAAVEAMQKQAGADAGGQQLAAPTFASLDPTADDPGATETTQPHAKVPQAPPEASPEPQPEPAAAHDPVAFEPTVVAPEPEPAPEPAPQPEPAPEPEPAPQPEPQPEPAPHPVSQAEPAPQPQPEPHPEPDARLQPSLTIPPSASASGMSPASSTSGAAASGAAMEAAAFEAVQHDQPASEGSNPLGPVYMDGLSPPTGKVASDAPEPAPAPAPASPDVLGDDPFAMPARPASVEPTDAASPFATGVGAPFGAPVQPSDLANPVSVLDDDFENNSWGLGSKLALALVVGLFLAGVFYIMSIG